MSFEIIGIIEEIETITVGGKIRDIMRLQNNLAPLDGENSKDLPWLGFRAGTFVKLNCTGMKPTVSVGRK